MAVWMGRPSKTRAAPRPPATRNSTQKTPIGRGPERGGKFPRPAFLVLAAACLQERSPVGSASMSMRTLFLKADELGVLRGAEVLRAGGLVAFPTETVYGLGADALSDSAVARIFEAKDRPRGNPLIVPLAGAAALETVAARVPPRARDAAARFWPGPLTLRLPRAGAVPLITTGGLETVAARVPSHT